MTFRTQPPLGFPPPSREEMKEVAERVGLKAYSPSLVQDLVNVALGGTVVPPSRYREQVRELAFDKARNKGTLGEGLQPHPAAWDSEFEKMMRYHSRVTEFIQTIDLSRFPGENALEQAMSLLKLLSTQKGGTAEGGGGENDSLPIFLEKDPQQVQDMLESVMEDVESLSDAEQDMIDPDGEGHTPKDQEKDQEQDGSRSGSNELQALKIAEKLMPGTDERKILEIARHLQQFVQLKVKKLRRVKEDPEGTEIHQRPIRHLGEIGKLPMSELAKLGYLPRGYFNYLAVTGRLEIRERVTREDKKQAIFILMDISGSTSRGDIRQKMTGVVMNRLLAVVNGEAEVYLGLFDTQLKVLGSAQNPEEARAMIKKFRAGNYSGGGTNIATGVKAAHAFIEEKIKAGEALWRPEVVVLTDEDSSSDGVTAAEIPGTKVHGFAMGSKNPNLVTLCQSTGGLAFEKF